MLMIVTAFNFEVGLLFFFVYTFLSGAINRSTMNVRDNNGPIYNVEVIRMVGSYFIIWL